MSSQRVARNASDGVGRALAPPDSNASAQLPTSIGNDDGADFDVSFAEVGVDPHDADGGDVTTSKVVRFGLRLSSSSSSSFSSALRLRDRRYDVRLRGLGDFGRVRRLRVDAQIGGWTVR